MGGIREMDGSFICIGHCEFFFFFPSLFCLEKTQYKSMQSVGRARKRSLLGENRTDPGRLKLDRAEFLHSD